MTETPPEPVDVRSILEGEGLLYRDGHSGEYVIPGAFLRNQVLLLPGFSLSQSISSRAKGLRVTGVGMSSEPPWASKELLFPEPVGVLRECYTNKKENS